MENNSKLISIISYLTFVGWVIALVMRQSEHPKSELSRYHLRQSLGLNIVGFIGWIAISWIAITLNFWALAQLFKILLLVYWVLGIFYAVQAEMKPLPFIGEWFEEKLDFIK